MHSKYKRRLKNTRLIYKIAVPLLILFLLFVFWFVIFRNHTIERFKQLQSIQDDNTIFYDIDQQPFHVIRGTEDRRYVKIEQINKNLQMAAVAIEDSRYFQHIGIDVMRMGDALLRIITFNANLHGASTITQQLIKMTLLSPERTFNRKITEIFMAMALETAFSKIQILELYLNKVYMGHRNFGVENVSLNYFHKSAKHLTLAESAFVAGLIKKPEGYSPFVNLKKARKRQVLVLKRMLQLDWISSAQYQQAVNESLYIRRNKESNMQVAPFFVSHILLELKKRYEHEIVYGGGLRIYTTLDRGLQDSMEKVISDRIQQEKSFSEVAGVSIEPATGFVKALVGGVDFYKSEFNRVTQAKRPPGSSFKPIVYAAALSKGMRPTDVFIDEPTRYSNSFEEEEILPAVSENEDASIDNPVELNPFYEPNNFNNEHIGPITVSHALKVSNNVVSVKILNETGISNMADVASRFGIYVPKERGLCLALGCLETTLLQMVDAYATFPNKGIRVLPVFVLKVTDKKGKVLETFSQSIETRVLSEHLAYQLNHMLMKVVESGTGHAADIGTPTGGKTGTSDEFRDAWYIGYTPDLVTGFWVGNDDNTPMDGEVGGRTPARLWKNLMSKRTKVDIQKNFPLNIEYDEFLICNQSGKLARPWCTTKNWYALQRDTGPIEYCDIHFESDLEADICSVSAKLASPYCPLAQVKKVQFSYGEIPEEYCDVHTPDIESLIKEFDNIPPSTLNELVNPENDNQP
jgi:penicillin-binding protein 1A